MWFKYESIEFKKGLKSKAGRAYDAWVLKGMKKGFDNEPDTPYEKTFFDNTTTSVIEKGVTRPNISIVSFFRDGCEPGDMIVMQYTKSGPRRNLDVENVRNLTKDSSGNKAQAYTPLAEQDAEDVKYVRDNQTMQGNDTPPWA